MLRIHFLPEDLSRTHVVSTSDPLWETLLSLQLSHSGDGRLVFGGWRRQVRSRTCRSVEAVLLPLSPPRGPSADLLTPAASTLGLEAGLEAVRATPLRLIRQDLHQLAAHHRLPAWTSLLADGEPRLLAVVAGALRAWHQAAVAPYQDHIDRRLDADRALRLRDARLGGPERVLAGLPPPLSWRPPTLVSRYPVDRDIHLDGRGLLLVPSFFCWRNPVTLIDAALPPVLVYPIEHDLEWLAHPDRPGARGERALAALLGGTRAAVLDTVGRGPVTTTGIAKQVHISAPSASEHASILRDAGLITTRRLGNTVLHSLSRAGAVLLDGARHD
ncbi:ArsR/SmtB family transcription factor [Phytohabitans aurantiacus]|uniref:ArsR/SmtB family transcription factor n=1 Tax=Phytohabitans aurantiacus TaxID=3016789 RepID=UPI00248FFD4B|nr:winged helix-turn-helix domain-containing protein [Phytohabitans aurantiacus]